MKKEQSFWDRDEGDPIFPHSIDYTLMNPIPSCSLYPYGVLVQKGRLTDSRTSKIHAQKSAVSVKENKIALKDIFMNLLFSGTWDDCEKHSSASSGPLLCTFADI